MDTHAHGGDAMTAARDATPITRAQNRAVLDTLPFDDVQDFEDARCGFVATLPEVEIKNDRGRVVWSLRDDAFLADADAPATVNPSLWRQARLNMTHGPFEVTTGIYQIRGFDISNMTIIEGEQRNMSLDHFFDYLGVRLNAEKAEGRRLVINWVFRDLGPSYVLTLENCALTYRADRERADADATVALERSVLNRLVLREVTFAEAVERGLVALEGDAARVAELFGLLDVFSLMFEVVEPKRESAAAEGRG